MEAKAEQKLNVTARIAPEHHMIMEEMIREGLYSTKSAIVQEAVAIFLDKNLETYFKWRELGEPK